MHNIGAEFENDGNTAAKLTLESFNKMDMTNTDYIMCDGRK